MTEGKPSSDRAMQSLRRAALGHADVQESVACKGTAIESSRFKVGGRAFLFLRSGRVMVRLDSSQKEASKLAGKKPACYKVASGGWTTVSFENPKDVSIKLLEKWIGESYGVAATAGASKKTRHK